MLRLLESRYLQAKKLRSTTAEKLKEIRCSWLQVLQQATWIYSQSKHSSLANGQFTPAQMNEEPLCQAIYSDYLWSKLRSEATTKRKLVDLALQVGDKVRLTLSQEEIKSRNWTQRYSDEVFQIYRILDHMYRPMYLVKTKDGELIEG